jgi:hypothetical protein
VSESDTVSRGFLFVDDYVFDVLSWMDGEVLITSTL